MAISYPLTPPASPGYRSRELQGMTRVGMVQSPFTGQQQVQPWQAQWLQFTFSLPVMTDAQAGAWTAFFMALNGREGTFYLGDSVRKVPRGTIAGTVTVGAGAVANATTLPLSGGTGAFAVGDWLQVFATTSARLHRVVQVNAGSVDVFPRLRSAYANGSAITYANPVGRFRLTELPEEAFDAAKLCDGLTFTAQEAL